MVHSGSIRTFDGKEYKYLMKLFHKEDLEDFKSRVKNSGFNVRIVTKYNKLDAKKYYLLYARKN